MVGSSSRRTVVSAGLACIAAAALGCGRREPVDSPWLTTVAPGEPEDAVATRAAAFWVFVDSLSPAARQRFIKAFDDALAAAEASFDPLGLELGEDLDQAARPLEAFLPQFNAAFAISAPSWALPGEKLWVRATSAEPGGGKARRAWGEESDGWARRLRFAAWPASDAVRLRASSSAEHDRLLARLREQTTSEHSPLAVIVTSQNQNTFAKVAQRDELLALGVRARRLAKAARKPHRLLELALAPIDAAEPARVAPWLKLKPLESLIVPRLATPQRQTALTRELETLLAGSQAVMTGGAGYAKFAR